MAFYLYLLAFITSRFLLFFLYKRPYLRFYTSEPIGESKSLSSIQSVSGVGAITYFVLQTVQSLRFIA